MEKVVTDLFGTKGGAAAVIIYLVGTAIILYVKTRSLQRELEVHENLNQRQFKALDKEMNKLRNEHDNEQGRLEQTINHIDQKLDTLSSQYATLQQTVAVLNQIATSLKESTDRLERHFFSK